MDLREIMGFMSQEPTLFNYSVKDNILYGFPKATNKDILEAAEQANVTEFIESDALEHAIMDDPENLLRNLQSTVYKEAVIAAEGQKIYDKQIQTLQAQVKRKIDEKEEKYEDLIDKRSKREKGN